MTHGLTLFIGGFCFVVIWAVLKIFYYRNVIRNMCETRRSRNRRYELLTKKLYVKTTEEEQTEKTKETGRRDTDRDEPSTAT